MIEKELKVLINECLYNKLLLSFEWHDCIKQTNYYYADEHNHLEKHNISVRVRFIDDRYFLQAKTPIQSTGVVRVRKEYEEEISQIPKAIDSSRLEEMTGHKPIGNALLIGELVTERHILNWGNDVTLCLDKNSYLDNVDYEVELEYFDDSIELLVDVLNNFGVVFDGDTKGKYSRFITIKRTEIVT